MAPALLAAQSGREALPGPAASLTEMAASAARDSEWSLVKAFAGAGLELEGGSSDLRYLGGRALLALGEGPGAALPELEAALAANRFAMVSEEDARLLHAELLVDMRRYTDALLALDAAGPPPSRGLLLRPEYRLLRARAFYGLGKGREARAELAEALRRFPDDPRFARLFFERETAPPSAEARELGRTLLRRLPELAAADPELSILALPFIPEASARRDSLLAYRASGKASVAAVLLALENGLIEPGSAVREFLRLGPRYRLAELERLAEDLGEGGQAALLSLIEALSSFTGSLVADRDGDGRAEEETLYEAGRIKTWSLDADQDGDAELLLGFEEGIPSQGRIEVEGLETEVVYSGYPYVASLRFADSVPRPLLGGMKATDAETPPARLFRFGADTMMYRPLELRAFPSPSASFYLPKPSSATLPLEREAMAVALDLRNALPEGEELLVLDRGIPLRRERFSGQRLIQRLDYVQGLPAREILDQDGDGRFEMERLYEAKSGEAVPAWVRIDLDGDGAFDYREELEAPFRKEWDYDGDGLVDAAESLGPEGWRLREFSTRFDGGFDERLLFDAQGRLRSAQREGIELPLLADANPSLTWLGEKPFDLGSNLPPAEGVYRHMGIRYRLIYAGQAAFAELLP